MPHRLADCGNRDILAFRDACPAMPGDVCCQRDDQPQLPAYFLQVPVYPVRLALVLPSFILDAVFDDRQQLMRYGGVVFFNKLQHWLLTID